MKNKIAQLLIKIAIRLDKNAIQHSFPAPSIRIYGTFEEGTNIFKHFGYGSGEDGKAIAGLNKLFGYDVFRGLHYMLDKGLVKEGAKEAVVTCDENNDIFVDGKKIEE